MDSSVWTLGRLVEHFAPESPQQVQDVIDALMPRSPLHGVLLFVLLGIGGPLVEELLFRGAIYTALRPGFDAVRPQIARSASGRRSSRPAAGDRRPWTSPAQG